MRSCELCGNDDWRARLSGAADYISGHKFELLRCQQCGLVVTHPMPADLSPYYPPRYRTERQKQTGPWRIRRRATMLAKQFPRNFRGRLLDLGCGNGHFALHMQRRGWTVAVTELDDAVLAKMRAAGMEAKRPDEALRDGFSAPFDAITAWHVLEHVPDPLRLAKWSQDRLAPNGVFQATVPNFDSWQAQLFGPYWFHLDVPRHLFHFTPGTLALLMDKAGLSIIETDTFAIEYDVFGVIQSTLNLFCSQPNALFELLTARGQAPPPRTRDEILCYALFPLLDALALFPCLAAAVCHKGATLATTCRKQMPHQ